MRRFGSYSRDVPKAQRALSNIKESSPKSNGGLEFLHLDSSDLSTAKTGADSLSGQKQRLDVHPHNDGVRCCADPSLYTSPTRTVRQSDPSSWERAADGHQLPGSLSCTLHYLCTWYHEEQHPRPRQPACVRVLWAASTAVHVDCPRPHGIMIINGDGRPRDQGATHIHGQIRVGNNVFFAREACQAHAADGRPACGFGPGIPYRRNCSGTGPALPVGWFLLSPYPGHHGGCVTLLGLQQTFSVRSTQVFWGLYGALGST